jgi:integrase
LSAIAGPVDWRIRAEILPLEWRQVDWTGRVVRLDPGTTKNREGRRFPFTAALVSDGDGRAQDRVDRSPVRDRRLRRGSRGCRENRLRRGHNFGHNGARRGQKGGIV